jgi:hypothetical protein
MSSKISIQHAISETRSDVLFIHPQFDTLVSLTTRPESSAALTSRQLHALETKLALRQNQLQRSIDTLVCKTQLPSSQWKNPIRHCRASDRSPESATTRVSSLSNSQQRALQVDPEQVMRLVAPAIVLYPERGGLGSEPVAIEDLGFARLSLAQKQLWSNNCRNFV